MTDVLASPAVAILRGLELDGFHVALTAAGGLVIAPKSKLTPERMRTIAGCKDALTALVASATDAGVTARRDRFHRQFVQAPAGTVPLFVVRAGISYQPGVCFSCGDPLPERRFGRCWRCALAWRLATGVAIPVSLAEALDTAKVLG